MSDQYASFLRKINDDIPKLNEWYSDVSKATADKFPPFPKITVSDLPERRQIMLQEGYTAREWHECWVCRKKGEEWELKQCSGCGHEGGHKTLYCSRKCQREDWPSHQSRCGKNWPRYIAKDSSANKLMSSRYAKMWRRQRVANGVVCAWALRQLRIMDPSINFAETMLTVYCSSIKSGFDYVLPHTLVLSPLSEEFNTPYPPQMEVLSDPTKSVGLVGFHMDGFWYEPHYVKIEMAPPVKLQESHHCHWPWIFASILAMGATSSKVLGCQIFVFLDALEPLRNRDLPGNPLANFAAPKKLTLGEPWTIYDFDRWQKMVGDIVAF